MSDPFDTATYYDCCDSEALQHESPEEALIEYFEAYAGAGLLTSDEVAGLCPVTVTAYERRPVNHRWLAKNAAETALDSWLDEYGGPDDYDGFDPEWRAALERAMEATIARVFRDHEPWTCRSVAEREYSAGEVEAILRRECPEWFE